MPSKRPDERLRRAKAEGTTVTVKVTDPGVQPREDLSPHAAKKSRGVIGEGYPEDRHVSRQKPPHTGAMRREPLEGDAESVLPRNPRSALPREERAAEMIREGHPERMSPGKKRRGEP